MCILQVADMTIDEVNFAMNLREPVVIARGGVEILRPFEIGGVAKMMRSRFDVERGKDAYYFDVILLSSSGNGLVHARPKQLDPADPERFRSMWERYCKMKEERDGEQ